MKITIEPTSLLKDQTSDANWDGILMQPVTVTLEYHTDPDAESAMALCAKALISYGFHQDNIRECLSTDLANDLFGTIKLNPFNFKD